MRNCLLMMALGLLFACAQPARADFISQVLGDNPTGFWILNDANTTAVDSSVNGFNGTYGPGVTPQGIAGPSWVPPPGLVANFTRREHQFREPFEPGCQRIHHRSVDQPHPLQPAEHEPDRGLWKRFEWLRLRDSRWRRIGFHLVCSARLLHNDADTAAEPVVLRGGRPGCEQRRQLLRERSACGDRGRNTCRPFPRR